MECVKMKLFHDVCKQKKHVFVSSVFRSTETEAEEAASERSSDDDILMDRYPTPELNKIQKTLFSLEPRVKRIQTIN